MTEETDFLDAISNGNIEKVKSLIQNGLAVDFDGEIMCKLENDYKPTLHHISPLLLAAETNNVDIIQVLLDAGADVNRHGIEDVINGEECKYVPLYCRQASATTLIYLLQHATPDLTRTNMLARGWGGIKDINIIISLVTDIQSISPYNQRRLNGVSVPFACESIAQGEYGIAKRFLEAGVCVTASQMKDHLQFKMIKQECAQNAENCIQKLTSDGLLQPAASQSILHVVRSKRDPHISPENYPVSLKNYLQKDNTHIPLEVLTAELQYHLGNTPTPRTLKQLQEESSKNIVFDSAETKRHIALFEERPDLQDIERLKELIQTGNISLTSALLHFQEGAVDSICRAAIHPDLTLEEKACCIAILDRYDNPTDIDNMVITTAQLNQRSIGQLQYEISSLRECNKHVSSELHEVKTELSELKQQNAQILDLLRNPQKRPALQEGDMSVKTQDCGESKFFKN